MDRLVRFAPLDMTNLRPLAEQRGSFDFMWSSCVVEHLGGYQITDRFILESLELLRPGGVAVHTTELNFLDVISPIEFPGCTFFTKAWVRNLGKLVAQAGARLIPLNPSCGPDPMDGVVDFPPFSWKSHMKVVIESGSILTTSVGLIIVKDL
jgi:SAM-dependent methyltransferase